MPDVGWVYAYTTSSTTSSGIGHHYPDGSADAQTRVRSINPFADHESVDAASNITLWPLASPLWSKGFPPRLIHPAETAFWNFVFRAGPLPRHRDYSSEMTNLSPH